MVPWKPNKLHIRIILIICLPPTHHYHHYYRHHHVSTCSFALLMLCSCTSCTCISFKIFSSVEVQVIFYSANLNANIFRDLSLYIPVYPMPNWNHIPIAGRFLLSKFECVHSQEVVPSLLLPMMLMMSTWRLHSWRPFSRSLFNFWARRRLSQLLSLCLRFHLNIIINDHRHNVKKTFHICQKHHHGYLPTSPTSSVSPSSALQDSSQTSPNASPALSASSWDFKYYRS